VHLSVQLVEPKGYITELSHMVCCHNYLFSIVILRHIKMLSNANQLYTIINTGEM